jgi:hypothetical protein
MAGVTAPTAESTAPPQETATAQDTAISQVQPTVNRPNAGLAPLSRLLSAQTIEQIANGLDVLTHVNRQLNSTEAVLRFRGRNAVAKQIKAGDTAWVLKRAALDDALAVKETESGDQRLARVTNELSGLQFQQVIVAEVLDGTCLSARETESALPEHYCLGKTACPERSLSVAIPSNVTLLALGKAGGAPPPPPPQPKLPKVPPKTSAKTAAVKRPAPPRAPVAKNGGGSAALAGRVEAAMSTTKKAAATAATRKAQAKTIDDAVELAKAAADERIGKLQRANDELTRERDHYKSQCLEAQRSNLQLMRDVKSLEVPEPVARELTLAQNQLAKKDAAATGANLAKAAEESLLPPPAAIAKPEKRRRSSSASAPHSRRGRSDSSSGSRGSSRSDSASSDSRSHKKTSHSSSRRHHHRSSRGSHSRRRSSKKAKSLSPPPSSQSAAESTNPSPVKAQKPATRTRHKSKTR